MRKQDAMIAFARTHDWGHDVEPVGRDAVRVAGWEVVGGSRENPNCERVPFVAQSMKQLREWAGY